MLFKFQQNANHSFYAPTWISIDISQNSNSNPTNEYDFINLKKIAAQNDIYNFEELITFSSEIPTGTHVLRVTYHTSSDNLNCSTSPPGGSGTSQTYVACADIKLVPAHYSSSPSQKTPSKNDSSVASIVILSILLVGSCAFIVYSNRTTLASYFSRTQTSAHIPLQEDTDNEL